MRVLLKGGPAHDKIIGLPSWKTELFIPIEQPISLAITDEDPMVPNLKVARYIKTGLQGYGHYNDIYPIWVYDGEV